MLSVNVGPLALPLGVVSLFAAALVAAAVGHWVGRRTQTGIVNALSDMLLAGVVAARIGFVAVWFELYRDSPWAMLDIRDGGFLAWAGVVAALLVALGLGARRAELRKPLAAGLVAGGLVWAAFQVATLPRGQTAWPVSNATTLTGQSIDLATLAAGKPVVVNLWASWCPPCRREMPVLAAAQQRETGVTFVFVNQGEDAATVQRFLAASGLALDHVLLDPGMTLGRELSSGSLPTTLFYDAAGHRVAAHLGELSAASLADKLARLRAAPAADAK